MRSNFYIYQKQACVVQHFNEYSIQLQKEVLFPVNVLYIYNLLFHHQKREYKAKFEHTSDYLNLNLRKTRKHTA